MKLSKLIERLVSRISTPTTLVRELKDRGYDALIVKSRNSVPDLCTPTIFIIVENQSISEVVVK